MNDTEGYRNFDYRGTDAPSAPVTNTLYDPLLDPEFGAVSNRTYDVPGQPGVVLTGGQVPAGGQPPVGEQPPVPRAPGQGGREQLPGSQAPRGPVTTYPLPGLDTVVVRAESAADMQLILDLIEVLRGFSKGAQPRLEVVPLEYADANNVADFLTTLFSRVITAGPGGNYLLQPGTQPGVGGLGGLGALGGNQVQLMSQMGIAGVLEFFGGLLIVLGLFTRIVAFVLSGQMATAYFTSHFPNGFFPIENGGELAALFCFVFLYFATAGPGRFSLDGLLRRVKGDAQVDAHHRAGARTV